MEHPGTTLSRLLRALLVSALLFALTGFLLAPGGSRRGEDMDEAASPLPSPSETAPAQATAAPQDGAFVGNKNSLVFHLPHCSSLSRTAEENRLSFATRQAALDAGYTPCQRCNP